MKKSKIKQFIDDVLDDVFKTEKKKQKKNHTNEKRVSLSTNATNTPKITVSNEPIVRYSYAEERKRLNKEEIDRKNEENRKKIIAEVIRLRETKKQNGKHLTYRDIALEMNISRTTVMEILNGNGNCKYIARRPKV